jgi:hypothetical protein
VGNHLEGGFTDPAPISMLHAESLTVGGKVLFAGEQQIQGGGGEWFAAVTYRNK